MDEHLSRIDDGQAAKLREFLDGRRPESRDEIIEALCALQTVVALSPAFERFPSNAADCFCDDAWESEWGRKWLNGGDVLRFIIRATLDRLIENEALFKPCVVEFCRHSAVTTGTIGLEFDEPVEVGFCAQHFAEIIGSSTRGLS
jgi:hypothetical protein